MKNKVERFKSAKEFGKSLGLSDAEMRKIRQRKNQVQIKITSERVTRLFFVDKSIAKAVAILLQAIDRA